MGASSAVSNILMLFYKALIQFWSQEQEDLNRLFEKYVPSTIDMIVEGIVDGKQGEKLKTIIPQTGLNMVS